MFSEEGYGVRGGIIGILTMIVCFIVDISGFLIAPIFLLVWGLVEGLIYLIRPSIRSAKAAKKAAIIKKEKAKSTPDFAKEPIDLRSVNFYIECSKLIKKGNKISEVLSIVAQKFGIANVDLARELFKKGEKEAERQKLVAQWEKEQAEKEKLAKLHKDEQLSALKESGKRHKTGKEKYLIELRKWIAVIENNKKLAASSKKLSESKSKYRAVNHSWGIAGGIAEGLGGAALGMAAAVDTQLKNERNKEVETHIHGQAVNMSFASGGLEEKTLAAEQIASRYLQAMEQVLLDSQNINDKFNLLKIFNTNISLTKNNNLCVKFKLNCQNDLTILSKPAILDGVLKVSVSDKENKTVATGYYVADGYGQYNYKNAGFKNESTISVVCPIDSFVDAKELRCEITPESLWLIEKNNAIFKVNNELITKAHDSYLKSIQNDLKEIVLNI